jgi:hypothetical protein
MEISGSCFCNTVQFKLNEDPKAVVNCHCNFCRKHSGAAFSTYIVVPEAALEITSGQDSISRFSIREDAHKHFCKQCGSPLFNQNERYPGLRMIYLGATSSAPEFFPVANIYCESQLHWVPAIAGIKSYAQGRTRQTEQ